MTTYMVTGINLGTFNLGEADKVITIFTAERGLIRAVAKGARKPGAKVGGRAEPLNVNKLLVATGRSLDIITQAESVETFPKLRQDLVRLSYALYYAELTQHFGPGLFEENASYFNYLRDSLRAQAEAAGDPAWLCLRFELVLLEMLGYRPELTYCVMCRQPLADSTLGAFHQEWGGIICKRCLSQGRSETRQTDDEHAVAGFSVRTAREITPLVWRHLVLASDPDLSGDPLQAQSARTSIKQALVASRRIVQAYIEHRAGKRMKSLDLVADFENM